jgi:hypothetical protein
MSPAHSAGKTSEQKSPVGATPVGGLKAHRIVPRNAAQNLLRQGNKERPARRSGEEKACSENAKRMNRIRSILF